VGPIPLLRDDRAALLQWRNEKAGLRHAGLWVLPGGHAQPGETIEAYARREFREETDYDCGQLHWLCSFKNHVDGWPPYELTVFWSLYDGTQLYTCREGQALEFVARDEAANRPMPAYRLETWDRATAHALASKPHKKEILCKN